MSVALKTLSMLDLPKGSGETMIDLSALVAKGLPSKTLERMSALMAPDDRAFRYRIVNKATLARREKSNDKRLSAEESDRVARLTRLWAVAEDVWHSETATRRFLTEPHPLLRGKSPLDLAIESEVGARAVEELLGRLAYGSAA